MAAHEACKRVLAELSADKLAVHFSVPVDTSVLTDYLAVVASPIGPPGERMSTRIASQSVVQRAFMTEREQRQLAHCY